MGYFDAITQPQQAQQPQQGQAPQQAMPAAGPIPFTDAGVFRETPGMFKDAPGTFKDAPGTFKDAPGTFMPDGSKQQAAAQGGQQQKKPRAPSDPGTHLGMPPIGGSVPRQKRPFETDLSTPQTSKLGLGMPGAVSFDSRIPSSPINDPFDGSFG